ncbi:MAG: LptF/LptG family permease [Proteobacteria bacterium]|nr:LptF/LptG family permease [Pseudomonadota bacterium]
MIIHNYIRSHVIGPFFLTTLVMTSIVWLAQAFRILDLIVSRGVDPLDFVKIAVLLLPSLIMLLLPIATMLAVLYVLYRMYIDRELVIYKSIGFSSWKIARPLLQVSLLITIISYANSAVFLPASYKQFKDMQDYFRNNYVALLLQESSFNSPIPGLTVYVESKDSNEVRGILVQDGRSDKKQTTITAARGKIIKTPGAMLLELEDGTHQEKNLKDGRLSILKFSHYVFNLELIGKSDKARGIDPSELTLQQLWQSIQRQEPGVPIAKGKANFHQRISWPLYSFTLSLLVLAIIVASPEYKRRTSAMKYIFGGILSGLILTLTAMSTNLGMRFPVAFAVPYISHVVIIIWSCWRLQRY